MGTQVDTAVTLHRKQVVAREWENGLSNAAIGRLLGVSRNSVAGYVKRMGLPKRSQDAIRQQGSINTASQKSKARGFVLPSAGASRDKTKVSPTKIPGAKEDEPKPIGLVADFPDRERTSCRYIHGEVSSGDWQLCGHAGYPWCNHHGARFSTPQTGVSRVDKSMERRSGIARALA